MLQKMQRTARRQFEYNLLAVANGIAYREVSLEVKKRITVKMLMAAQMNPVSNVS